MADSFEITGFAVSLEGDEAIFSFAAPDAFQSEIPVALDETLRAEFQPGGRLAGRRVVVSLHETPAMSSRQLGALLAVYGAAGGRNKLIVRGVRPNVRDLFEMTKMGSFFDY